MATDRSYILELRSAKDLVEVLTNPSHAQLYALIKAYFTAYCDCDIRTWLIDRIQEEKTASTKPVTDAIKLMIRGQTPAPLANVTPAASAGYLLATFCLGSNLMGRYYTGTAPNPPTYEAMLIASHPQCAPPDDYWIRDALMDTPGVLFLNHLPEIGGIWGMGSNPSDPKYDLAFKAEGLDHVAVGPEEADDGSIGDDGPFLANSTYVNDAEIDSTQAEHGITYRTGITAGKPDWPVFSRIVLATRMESFEPTNNPEREQMHFEFQFRNGPEPSDRDVLLKVWYKGYYDQYQLEFSYDQFYKSMSPADKANFDSIVDYPKIFTRRASVGVGYEIKIRLRCVKGMWQLFLNDQYMMEDVYDETGDLVMPYPVYWAGLGYRHYSSIYGESPAGAPTAFKTHLSDYYVRRLTETGRVDLTYAMLSQDRFFDGNSGGVNFDNLQDSEFFVLGKIPEDRDNNSTPDDNIISHAHGWPGTVVFPFKLDGVPEINGVPDYSGVTFTKWGYIGGGLEIGELLGSRTNGSGVATPNRWVLEPDDADKIGIQFDSTTGRGSIVNIDPDNTYTSYALISVSVNGKEILSITVQFTAPYEDSSNPGEYSDGYSRVGFANDLYYPYAAYSLLF